MEVKVITPILNVSDIQQSFKWFQKLGWQKGWDWGEPPTFGGVCSGDCEGIEVTWEPEDMSWGVREMHIRHPDGHVFRVSQSLERQ